MFSWLICSLALAAVLVVIGPRRLLSPPEGSEAALIGGDFTLQNGEGKSVHARDFRGRYMLVYFGFTHCPDICPTTLLVMKNALEKLGSKREKISPIFISLDPERDTTEVMKQYVSNFDSALVGLTGTPQQIKQAAEAYRVYYSKVTQEDSSSSYLIDHSGFIYLMDTKGRYLAHFSHTIPETELASKIGQMIP